MSDQSHKPSLWDVLEEYADVRDEFDDLLCLCGELQDDLRYAIAEISDTLDGICNHLASCDSAFRRYKRTRSPILPFPEDDLPFTEDLPEKQ